MFPDKLQRNGKPFITSNRWAKEFMARGKLSMRLATTNKHVTTSEMRKVQFQSRNKFAADFHHVQPLLVYNMDETSVTLDAPGMRTAEKKGAKCVELSNNQSTRHSCSWQLTVSGNSHDKGHTNMNTF